MRLLRSPWVTGILVLVAVVVVFFQVLKPYWPRLSPFKKQAAAAPVAAVSAPPVNTAPAAVAVVTPDRVIASETTMDRSFVESRFSSWVDSPPRDPFLLLAPVAPEVLSPNAPSRVAQWKLKGIWRQSGSRVAVIDKGIYHEGEMIGDYKVERIEDDQVWLLGPTRRESLRFGGTRPTGAAAPAPKK